MFHWANLQEDGLAAYHLQKQSVGGGWEEVESFAPGTDNYTIKVSGDGKFRILAEQVDGQSTSREF